MPERFVKLHRRHAAGGMELLAQHDLGPRDKVSLDTDEATGNVTIVLESVGGEADDAIVQMTHEHVRRAPKHDEAAGKLALASEGGVHEGVDPDGQKVVDPETGETVPVGNAPGPAGPDQVQPADRAAAAAEAAERQAAAAEQAAAASSGPDYGSGKYESRTVDQLSALARSKGVSPVPGTKKEIIKAIRATGS